MPDSGHSSKVNIRLYVDANIVRVAQVGGQSLILGESFECAPESEGELVIVVDGHKMTYPILLDNGIQPDDREVKFSDIAPMERGTGGFLFTMSNDLPF